MISLSLLIPVYRRLNQRFRDSLLWFLRARVKGLDAEIRIKKAKKWLTDIEIRGSDAKTAGLFLKNQFSAKRDAGALSTNEAYAGNIVKITSNALVVDIGLRDPRFLINIAFNDFLEEILGSIEQHPRERFRRFGLRTYFPLKVQPEVLVPVNQEDRLKGNVASETTEMFREWLHLPYNRVFVYGETRGKIKEALSKAGHGHDVLNIERLGFLECDIVCKEGTSAVGLIPEIGPYLKKAELTAFQLDSIKGEKLEKKT